MKNYILTGLIALGLFAIGCSDNQIGYEEMIDDSAGGDAVMFITLQGSQDATRATGTANDQYEDDVLSFAVYVFSSNNEALEAKVEFLNGETSGQIGGLGTATDKDVVVLVNYPGAYPDVDNYTDLISTTLSLDTQNPSLIQTNGLFMSGDTLGVTLTAEGPNAITVNVGRLVAKVKLMSLIVNPSTASLSDFDLIGVSMQRVRNTTNMLGDLLATGSFEYVGGYQTSGSGLTPVGYLYEQLYLPNNYTAGNELIINNAFVPYFYLFPNDNTNDSSTLISIRGTYKGEEVFYSYRINDEILSDGQSNTDGEWIKSNTVYNIYFTLDKIELGGDDPNKPNVIVTADLAINVSDWALDIVQYIHY